MSKANAVINTRVKPEIKEQFEYIVSKLGLTPSAAINLYISSVVRNKGIALDLFLENEPNEETLKSMDDAVNGKDLIGPFNSVEEARAALNA